MSEGASYVLDRGFLAFEGEEWWLYSLGRVRLTPTSRNC